jgi:hypothetical protein
MAIRLIKHLQAKKGFDSFALPIVLITIIVLFFFLQEAFVLSSNRFLVNKSLTEKELLNDLVNIGNNIAENLLIQKGTGAVAGSGSFRSIISENPKVYLDMNGDGIIDSVIIYTFINISSSKIEFALTAYRLKRSECGKTDHSLLTMNMESGSTRKIKILSNNYSTQTQVSEYIQFSIKVVNSVNVLNQLTLIKKLNLVSND